LSYCSFDAAEMMLWDAELTDIAAAGVDLSTNPQPSTCEIFGWYVDTARECAHMAGAGDPTVHYRPFASSEAPLPTPCPLCRHPIASGDSAGHYDGRILHLDCYIAVLRASAALLAQLRRHADEALCTTCLVSAMNVTFDEAALAHAWLRTRPGIRFAVAACAVCGGRRVTLTCETSARGAGVRD